MLVSPPPTAVVFPTVAPPGRSSQRARIGEGFTGSVDELAKVGEGLGIVGVNEAVAEVSDEEIVAEDSEVGGSEGDSPGRVEVTAGDGAGDEVA